MKKIHIIKINITGGIITAGQSYEVLCAASNARIREAQLGARQQLYFKVGTAFLDDFTAALTAAGVNYEVNTDDSPNIVSSYVTEEVFQNGNWLGESVYRDILDLFDYKPALKINVVDNSQTFVPFFTGHINFIASYTSNYWFMYVRLPGSGRLYRWPSLVYSADIPKISRLTEAVIFEQAEALKELPRAGVDLLTELVYQRSSFITQPIDKELDLPEFSLPYYEGFNSYGNKTWLGIHSRDELYDVNFLKDLCAICIKTRLGHVYTTPWKSIVIKNIQPADRKYWNHILGKYRINVRHASNELNWQVEDLNDEGLALKRFLVRGFDKDDVRTYGLCFGIKMVPQSNLFGSVFIQRQENRAPNRMKALDRYEIWYTREFNPNSTDYILFRKDIEKENLGQYLVSLCKYYYEWQSKEAVDHSIYQVETVSAARPLPEDVMVFQCPDCLTVYDPSFGDPAAGIAPGVPLSDLLTYECPTCGNTAEAFVPVAKRLLELQTELG